LRDFQRDIGRVGGGIALEMMKNIEILKASLRVLGIEWMLEEVTTIFQNLFVQPP
jgi:hypothetical protein